MSENVYAPWTPEQVEVLNLCQRSGVLHPFTCPRDGHSQLAPLLATAAGWTCPNGPCDYTQAWAPDYMADRQLVETWAAERRPRLGDRR